jgi:hypothetical protein
MSSENIGSVKTVIQLGAQISFYPYFLECCSQLDEIPRTKPAGSATKPCSFRANRNTEGQAIEMGANEITLSVCREDAWPFKSKECLDKVRVLRQVLETLF